MVLSACLWCETTVRADAPTCPECGLQNPAGKVKAAVTVVRHGRRALWGLVAVPVMLAIAYAAHLGALPLVSADAAAPAATRMVSLASVAMPTFTDPLQQAVWTDGVKAVRQALGQPGYGGFQSSFVTVSTGNIVSLCGQIDGTSGYESATGERRFISVFGQTAATTLEGNDTSFDVLWNRVCGQGNSPA
jgi:hypothetical protein